jgi:hypothetical protein
MTKDQIDELAELMSSWKLQHNPHTVLVGPNNIGIIVDKLFYLFTWHDRQWKQSGFCNIQEVE